MFTSSYFHIYFIQKRKDIIWELQIALGDASDILSRPSELPCSTCLSVEMIVCWCFQLSMFRFFVVFFLLFFFCISYQGVFDASKDVCSVLDISEYMNIHSTDIMHYSINIYCRNIGNQYVNSIVNYYYANSYLSKHIRHMIIATATTIIKATTTPNTIYDTPLYSVYSSVNIDDQINDNYMIKLTSKLN